MRPIPIDVYSGSQVGQPDSFSFRSFIKVKTPKATAMLRGISRFIRQAKSSILIKLTLYHFTI